MKINKYSITRLMTLRYLISTLFLFVFSNTVYSQDAEKNNITTEKILSFHSDIEVLINGDIIVTETYSINVLGEKIKRGIIRSLLRKEYRNNRPYYLKYKFISVKRNGEKEKYDIEKLNSWYDVRIGDRDILLEKGVHEYEVKYKVSKIIDFYDNYDEFYWNVNGNDWDFRIDYISAGVTFPDGSEIIQSSCYTGGFYSSYEDCTVKQISDNEIKWTAEDLLSGHGLTVAAGIKKGVIKESALRSQWVPYFLAPFLFGFIIYCFNRWQEFGKDFPKKIIVTEYFVPENLSPAALGYIDNEKMSNRLFSASLVNLAIKGYIRIQEIKSGKYTLHRLKEDLSGLPAEEAVLLTKLFGSKDKNSIDIDGSYNSSVLSAKNSFTSSIESNFGPIIKKGRNIHKILPALWTMTGIYYFTLFIIAFAFNDYGDIWQGILVGGLLLLSTLILAYSVNKVQRPKHSFFNKILFGVGVLLLLFFILVEIFYLLDDSFLTHSKWANLFLVSVTLVFIPFAYLIKQPTERKLEMQALIEGFKRYLNATEKKYLQFENPPKVTPEIFEEYLPYAIVIGAEKVWGERFKNQLILSAIEYKNDWYSGKNEFEINTINRLGSGVGRAFATSSIVPSPSGSSYSSSSSSGWSGGSGSSGGGYSGGGHGGGGGRGW